VSVEPMSEGSRQVGRGRSAACRGEACGGGERGRRGGRIEEMTARELGCRQGMSMPAPAQDLRQVSRRRLVFGRRIGGSEVCSYGC